MTHLRWLHFAPIWLLLLPVTHTYLLLLSLRSRMPLCARMVARQLGGVGVEVLRSAVGSITLNSNWWPVKKVQCPALHMDNWPVTSQSTPRVCSMLAS